MKIGVVGYCPPSVFDIDLAREYIKDAFDYLSEYDDGFEVVSGLTNVGILALAYEEAVARGYSTTGIACSKALAYELFPVDRRFIVGDGWGDESKFFIDYIDVLVRIGGGPQSAAESRMAKAKGKLVLYYDLPKLS